MATVKRDAAASRKACDMERRRDWAQKYADQEKVVADEKGPKTTTFHDYDLEGNLGVPWEALPFANETYRGRHSYTLHINESVPWCHFPFVGCSWLTQKLKFYIYVHMYIHREICILTLYIYIYIIYFLYL